MTVAAPKPATFVGRVPLLKPGKYADGLPFHDLHYVCCKLVLRPNHFRSRKSLFDFCDVLSGPAKEHEASFSVGAYKDDPIQIREVLFIDTPDFRLYNNGFILRRRIRYEDGFPAADPEIVFKFRHTDLQTAAETDVRRTSSATIGSSSSVRRCRSEVSSAACACCIPTTCSSRVRT